MTGIKKLSWRLCSFTENCETFGSYAVMLDDFFEAMCLSFIEIHWVSHMVSCTHGILTDLRYLPHSVLSQPSPIQQIHAHSTFTSRRRPHYPFRIIPRSASHQRQGALRTAHAADALLCHFALSVKHNYAALKFDCVGGGDHRLGVTCLAQSN